ncbi:hypothetical protein [Corynebacterium coyleae]|nr:hypothetical protein [Corynebacterium coyleae]
MYLQNIQDYAVEQINEGSDQRDFLVGYIAGAKHAQTIVIEELLD